MNPLPLLFRAALTGQAVSLPGDFTFAPYADTLRRQGLVPLAFQGACNCGIPMSAPLMDSFRTDYFRTLLHHERQQAALDRLYAAFEAAGVDYLPLKGAVLKPLYPQPELRPMGDADILIRLDQYAAIRPILEDLGFAYQTESGHEIKWDHPALRLELHKCLFAPAEADFYAVFGTGWSRAVPEGGHRYALAPEDHYLYLFAHMTKHYRSSGIGARHILDLWVCCQANPGMNWDYVDHVLAQLDLLTFHQNIGNLLSHWFYAAPASEKTRYIAGYVLSGGSWGSLSTRFASEQARTSTPKPWALLRAVFPTAEKMAPDFPILYRYPRIYPLLWLPRILVGILTRPREIGRKFRILFSLDRKKVTARQEALRYVGLK